MYSESLMRAGALWPYLDSASPRPEGSYWAKQGEQLGLPQPLPFFWAQLVSDVDEGKQGGRQELSECCGSSLPRKILPVKGERRKTDIHLFNSFKHPTLSSKLHYKMKWCIRYLCVLVKCLMILLGSWRRGAS